MAPRAELVAAIAIAATAACHRGGDAARDPREVPHATSAIDVDGEWNEADWAKRALRHQFVGSDGTLARPSSEIRLLRDDDTLYVGLYAADDDIRSATDAFEIAVGEVSLRVGPTGVAAPVMPGVRVGVDRDGTMDDPTNYDEEWVLEIAIPLASLGDRTSLAVTASRCDVPRRDREHCGSWRGTIVVP